MHKDAFLQCYPFWSTHASLAEGFSDYDGALGDEPGAPHKGIDYIVRAGGAFMSFDVCAMHDGMAYQGVSDSWGNFVYLMTRPNGDGIIYATVYAHLDGMPSEIPLYTGDEGISLPWIEAKTQIGRAGTSGDTKGRHQLHIELHTRGASRRRDSSITKIDPYGLNDRASSGRYPKPGSSLKGLDHFWTSNLPSFADGDPYHGI